MAKELNGPVIQLSQLSRNSENRQQHKLIPSDLHESRAIEQDGEYGDISAPTRILYAGRSGIYAE